jgi:hypothetical protein
MLTARGHAGDGDRAAALFPAARTHAEELGMRALFAGANPRSRA